LLFVSVLMCKGRHISNDKQAGRYTVQRATKGLLVAAILAATASVATASTQVVLHSFAGDPEDGSEPYGDLLADGAGNIYGTTQFGGTSGGGVVFKLTPGGHEIRGVYRNVSRVTVSCAYLLEPAWQSVTYSPREKQRSDGSRNPEKSGAWRSIAYDLARLGNPPYTGIRAATAVGRYLQIQGSPQ
jgi:uncharacterized repeat protein (TIGR03803 family)